MKRLILLILGTILGSLVAPYVLEYLTPSTINVKPVRCDGGRKG
jgi:uncharacterized membrane protein YwzB